MSLRPIGLVGVLRNGLAAKENAGVVRRLGYRPLTSEEEALPLFNWGGSICRRDRWVRPVDWDRPGIADELEINSEKFPSLEVASFLAMISDIRTLLDLEPGPVNDARERLNASHQGDRYYGTRNFAQLGYVAAQPLIPRVIELLRTDEWAMVRRAAAHALGHVGYDRDDVREALEASREDAQEEVRRAAADALEALRIGHYELT